MLEARPSANACSGKSGQETDAQPSCQRDKIGDAEGFWLREYLATSAASSRKQNVAVDADSQLSCQPTSAAPSNISPDAATSQYSVLLRLLVHSCGDTKSSSPTQTTNKPHGFSLSAEGDRLRYSPSAMRHIRL